ncbi:hypothetical protein K443DRAFT_608591 [Laccaria amethystina LaAM-08-1]|uniref:Amine oxidase domain-containing protein n=1 Tax=Laccaria amethystina LaAM-08-1 TaxID=1095629 RepID=A0A0C9Y2J3_9AGAR|nr:hypothetical protein K443DRAFT_608591 [Laccaria amethystina LaAM-08-1]
MKVAVVGSGVSGLAATWLLNEHSDHEVHLYESDYRPGGHANTVRFLPKGKSWENGVDVDTGFIVFNPTTYPNFLRFLQRCLPSSTSSIRILPAEMTFSVSRDQGTFEWAGKNLATVFCQPRRLFDPQMWRMVYDVVRFNASARNFLLSVDEDKRSERSIGDYLDQEGYSEAFRNNYLIPMTAAIWSTPPGKCILDFPAQTLIQFMYNHHLLQIIGRPPWRTIQGGSQHYVDKIIEKLPRERYHLQTPVTSVASLESEEGRKQRIQLVTADGNQEVYDHVILACHSDEALKILRAGGITEDEDRILSQIEWSRNEVVLHSDVRLMPRSRMAWSCWNYLTTTTEDDGGIQGSKRKRDIDRVSLTYGMNDLQHISEELYGPVLVTLNPPFEPDAAKVGGRWKYQHPVLNSKAVRAQREMRKIQNKRSISFAGAWLKYGFHEDGFTSGLLAACSIDEESIPATELTKHNGFSIPVRRLTVRPPFEIQHADHHLMLNRFDFGNVVNGLAARLFNWLERSGLRWFIGAIGSFVLGVLAWLFGVRNIVD